MKLAACLPCRVQSTRLYAKPLQHLDVEGGITILEYLVSQIKSLKEVAEIVLAVAEGDENRPFVHLAKRLEIRAVSGDSEEVLSRMIAAAQSVQAETVLRITSECPFIYFDNFSEVYRQHLEVQADLTVIENLPDGAYYELVQTSAFVHSYQRGHRGAWVTLDMKENPQQFKIVTLKPPPELRRPDLRLTVDYPEDLVALRKIYQALAGPNQFPSLWSIIQYLDSHPEIKNLVCAFTAGPGRIWA